MHKPPFPLPLHAGALCVLLATLVAGCPAAPTTGLTGSPAPRKTPKASASPSPSPLATLSAQASEVPATASPLASPSAVVTPQPTPSGASAAPSASPTADSATPTPEPTANGRTYTTSTLAGGTAGYVDATGLDARFNSPNGIDVNADGNLFVADAANNRIRLINPAGAVITLVGAERGFADGAPAVARLDNPYGVAVGPDGTVYIADTGTTPSASTRQPWDSRPWPATVKLASPTATAGRPASSPPSRSSWVQTATCLWPMPATTRSDASRRQAGSARSSAA